ncbi:MAG TPA: hypothetical protein VES69_12865 [Pyrinomonadaceae bacterium]|nr:hypothetical protein [Pyrinomonadaceae bacterium]
MTHYYENQSEIEAVVEGFESCVTAKDDFTHRSHLTVAVYYLHNAQTEATEKMRAGLLRFLDHHGVGRAKFHETLTIFWIRTVSAFLERLDQKLPLLEMTNAVIESLGDSRSVFEYYSEGLLRTDESRNGWVAPDLKDL